MSLLRGSQALSKADAFLRPGPVPQSRSEEVKARDSVRDDTQHFSRRGQRERSASFDSLSSGRYVVCTIAAGGPGELSLFNLRSCLASLLEKTFAVSSIAASVPLKSPICFQPLMMDALPSNVSPAKQQRR